MYAQSRSMPKSDTIVAQSLVCAQPRSLPMSDTTISHVPARREAVRATRAADGGKSITRLKFLGPYGRQPHDNLRDFEGDDTQKIVSHIGKRIAPSCSEKAVKFGLRDGQRGAKLLTKRRERIIISFEYQNTSPSATRTPTTTLLPSLSPYSTRSSLYQSPPSPLPRTLLVQVVRICGNDPN